MKKERHEKSNNKYKNTLMFKIIGLFISVTLFVLFFCLSFSFNQVVDTLNYTQSGNADYSVKLLPNNEHGAITMTSGSNKSFESSIVDQIKPQFNYELHSDKDLTIKYKYTISSTLYYLNNTNGEELKRDYQVLDEGEINETSRDFYLRKSIDIDFQKYQENIKQYKKLVKTPVKSKLVVSMNVSLIGYADHYSDTLSKTITEEITLPIGELTTDINISTPSINDSGKIYRIETISIKNIIFSILDIIFFISVVYFNVLVIKDTIVLSNNKDN